MTVSLLPAEQDLLNEITDKFQSCDDGIHRQHRDRWEDLYSLYRSHQDLKSNWRSAGPNDKDGVLFDAKRQWGAELFIPYSFSAVETITPRAVSQRPRMLVLPNPRPDATARDIEQAERNAEFHKYLIDHQQDRIDYDLVLQDVLKSGLIYGFGGQKCYWRVEKALERHIGRSALHFGKFVDKGLRTVTVFDDACAEDIDIFDLFWDPMGSDVRTCAWMLHRIWLSTEQVMARLAAGQWNTPAAQLLEEDDVRSSGGGQEYSRIWQQRMQAKGLNNFQVRGEQPHEVWEYHDGQRVVTILDRSVVVQDAENPCAPHLPFQVYRPIKVQREMVGIGVIEPFKHLQYEINTLRSQRRDNATLKLMQSFAYNQQFVDKDDIVFGPAMLIPTTGDPRNLIYPIQVGDIPNSGYQEEAALQRDIERVTGVDDTLSGGVGTNEGAAATATGVQLVQAAANKRIENVARRLEVEIIRGGARIFLKYNQRRILNERVVRVPKQNVGEGDQPYDYMAIGPEDLQGDFDVIPEGGSTQPENTPQLRQDAQLKWQLFAGNPHLDQTELLKSVLKDLGVKAPDSWILPDPKIDPRAMAAAMQQAGLPPEAIQQLIGMAHQLEAQAQQQGGGGVQAQPDQPPEQAAA